MMPACQMLTESFYRCMRAAEYKWYLVRPYNNSKFRYICGHCLERKLANAKEKIRYERLET